MMRNLRDIEIPRDVPVLVRSGLNVPLGPDGPRSTFRLRRALRTIEHLQARKARIIIAGHIGRESTATLRPVYEYIKEKIPGVYFSDYVYGSHVRERIHDLLPGEVLILENLRRQTGEQANDSAFAKELAGLADIFVQDAFDTCHRQHASIVGIPEYLSSYAGLVLEDEVAQLTKALNPKAPSLAIVGGAKFRTKVPFIKKLLKTYDEVFIGGALANDLLYAQGVEVGRSLVSGTDTMLSDIANNPRIHAPRDVIVETSGDDDGVRELSDIHKTDTIMDAGPQTIAFLKEKISNARTVLWNGPLGYYEGGYRFGNESVARAISESDAYSVLGGGDTVAALEELQIEHKIDFVSTGGGAMLDFLVDGSLPGIDALE